MKEETRSREQIKSWGRNCTFKVNLMDIYAIITITRGGIDKSKRATK